MDYYKILNLSEDASIKEIEQAYLDLSSFYNPKNNASKLAYKKYREVEKAYKVLKENKQREIYNLSRKDIVDDDKKINYDGTKLTDSDFNKDNYDDNNLDINNFKDEIVENSYSNYLTLNIDLPYIYYLTNSEYEVEFYKTDYIYKESDCKYCLGIGKVKENDEVVYCKECNGVGKEAIKKEEFVRKTLIVDEKVILNDEKVIVEFNFFDKDNYELNGNEIIITHNVTEKEYYSGVNWILKNNDEVLTIKKDSFQLTNDTYIFLDKVIKIEWILSSYKGMDKKGYLITNKSVIYLNPKDYSFSYKATDVCNYKIEIDSLNMLIPALGEKGLNDSNGDLLLEVINLENKNDLKILFDKKIKKVSCSLFKLKGTYNNHYFTEKKSFDYDEEYVYIPSLAYKLEMKHFTLFKILFSLIYLFIPVILFIFLGISYAFFISSFIVLVSYLIMVNLLMEVKI